ncbi:MAG: hypothetical protein ACPGSO_05445 [Vicingaceae bacterium]
MEKEELNKIISQLESSSPKDIAYFSIEQYGGGPDESHIKSNKEGLKLIASQLLKAVNEFDDTIKDENKSTISFDEDTFEYWEDGDVFFDYIIPINNKNERKNSESAAESFKDKLVLTFIIIILFIILSSIFIGLGTMISWLF